MIVPATTVTAAMFKGAGSVWTWLGGKFPKPVEKMPGTVGVTVLAARDLPVMDRASELTDAFVEVR